MKFASQLIHGGQVHLCHTHYRYLDFRGLNAFCVRAVEKEKKIKKIKKKLGETLKGSAKALA